MDDESFQDDTIRDPLFGVTSAGLSDVSPLEQEVLDEYTRLLNNMNRLSSTLSTLSSGPITLEIAEGLRLLERKVASVYTLMKASVYSIVLQQGHLDSEDQPPASADETMVNRGAERDESSFER